MHPAPVFCALLVALMQCYDTNAAKWNFLRNFVVLETDKEVEQVKPNTPAKNVTIQPVITSPKDAQFKLSYADYDVTWTQFKLKYKRNYKTAEEEYRRFAIFMDNVKYIERHNWQFQYGLTTYWMDINQFTDWTTEEWRTISTGVKVNESSNSIWGGHESLENLMNVDVPDSIDWRKYGYVTGVKDQGQCGSCWAFSTTGSLEGQWFKKTGGLVSLSEQQLVDCSSSFGNKGCNGGWVSKAFNYIKFASGIEGEQDYPYVPKQMGCRFDRTKVKAKVTGFVNIIPRGNEISLKNAVGTYGPVSVGIVVTRNFQSYAGGIFVDSACSFGQINHAVLVVGYGNTGGQDYWMVKNSWGTTWGISGYIAMARNRGNMCMIASVASFPTV